MKITIVGPIYPYRGGIAHFTAMLAQNLQDAGNEIQVISFQRQYPKWLYPGKTDKDNSQQPLAAPAEYPLDPLYPWTWLKAAGRIAAYRPDIVVIMWWTTFWAPAFTLLARWLHGRGIRVAFLIHNVMPHEARPWDRWLSRLALSSASRFIVLSEREAKRLLTLLPKSRPVVTPLPVYDMFAGQSLSRSKAREIIGLAEGDRVILFFGIVRPYKGLRYLMQAFKLLLAQVPDARLVVAGEFWEPRRDYDSLMDELGIRKEVTIFDRYIPNEEIPAFFTAADVFAAPYVDGTQSAAVKMALGFGLPIAMTNCIVDDMLAGQSNIWPAVERDAQSLSEALYSALLNGTSITVSDHPKDSWEQIVQIIESLEKPKDTL